VKRSPLTRSRKPLRRKVGLKARRVPKAFQHRRDYAYRQKVAAMPCFLRGRTIAISISPNDRPLGLAWRGFEHRCWGRVDPAHIGKHRATGADDWGAILPFCRAAHQYYDEHRLSFYRVTGYTPIFLAWAAHDLAEHTNG
jgi:hypothetical protein